MSAIPRPFHQERRRLVEAEGPRALLGVTQAQIGQDRLWRDPHESESNFRFRASRLARQRGHEFFAIEGLEKVRR
jgi:hypothetical protein